MIRIWFWGPLYYKYNKEPPKFLLVLFNSPVVTRLCWRALESHSAASVQSFARPRPRRSLRLSGA